MTRHHDDWLTAFTEYAQFGEAPPRMYQWVGVSAVAGALRRKVWIDQAYFRWHPNFYIILVAPPGIVSKSTTAGIAMQLLRRVPGIRFGPDVVTWQALVGAFAEASEAYEYAGDFHTMSPLTLESSEFGNLLNPQDKEMVDLLVNLWDGRQGAFEKRTKMSGNDTVVNPWINLIACTTPSWIASNFPEYMVGGGFTSRCVFVYADRKERYVAYPGLHVPADLEERASRLVADLEHISISLTGEYKLTPAAIRWGEHWYQEHYDVKNRTMDDDRFGGYVARKQTHVHKLAMVLAACRSDELVLTDETLERAAAMVTDLEADMPQVFSKIGRSDVSLQTDRFVNFVQKRRAVAYNEAYRFIHAYFPSHKEFQDVLMGAISAGLVKMEQRPDGVWLVATSEPD